MYALVGQIPLVKKLRVKINSETRYAEEEAGLHQDVEHPAKFKETGLSSSPRLEAKETCQNSVFSKRLNL